MTPAEELAVVRARLERMVTLARSATPGPWYDNSVGDLCHLNRGDADFVIAASPDLLLRLAREALGVLDRHRQHQINCGNVVFWPIVRFCPEVKAILRAWQP